LALLLVGRRAIDLSEQWRADFYEPDGQPVPVSRQLRHARGYVIAAIRYRLVNDLGSGLGKRLDVVLVSRRRTFIVVGSLFASPVVMVLCNEGVYGLVTRAESLCGIGGLLGLVVQSAREWRGVHPPSWKRPPR
jgi:hypothetical protein